MILQERVAENVYFFQSKSYAEVNAGVVVGPDMAVVIDTLAFPEETMEMRDFIENYLQIPVKYVINTHYHADHSWGNYLFPSAKIIAHTLCHQYLKERGSEALAGAQAQTSAMRSVKIVLPHITFDHGELVIKVGKKNLRLFPLPGHSPDNIGVLIEEDRALFSGDTIMAIPYIVDGNIDDTINSMKHIAKLGLENIVQGHGDIILRGEVEHMMKDNIDYLTEIRKAVRKSSRRKYPLDLLEEIDVESCGKSRVLLGGLTGQLHRNNLIALYQQIYEEYPLGSEEYFEEVE